MQHTIHRFALLALSCTLGACDVAGADTAALDLHVAAAALAAADRAGVPVRDADDLEPFTGDALQIDAPTLRDVVEGRVAPQISAEFATIDDPGCPQALAAAGLIAAPAPARPVTVAVDEALLDTAIDEACLRRDAATGAATLVACAAGETALGDLSARPNVSAGNCYWCADGFPCFGSKRRYEGLINNGQCFSVGYAGCNCS